MLRSTSRPWSPVPQSNRPQSTAGQRKITAGQQPPPRMLQSSRAQDWRTQLSLAGSALNPEAYT